MWEGWFQKLIARALFIHLIAWFYVDESTLLCLKAEILENSSSLYTSFLRNYYIIYFANVVYLHHFRTNDFPLKIIGP